MAGPAVNSGPATLLSGTGFMARSRAATPLLIAFAVTAGSAVAQDVIELDPISVTDDQGSDAEPRNTVLDRQTLEEQHPGAPLDTVLRSVPGVSVQGGGDGSGEMAVSIRGLQDQGRVAVTIDGVRQNFARSGHGANGTFTVDQEMLREVEVTRGLGGKAGAIAGAVEMRTVRADDLVQPDGSPGGEVRLRYGTLSKSPTVHGAWATRLSAAADLTIAATRVENDSYVAPNGQFVDAWQLARSGLVSLGFDTEAGHRFTFSADMLSQDYVQGTAATARDTDLRKRTYSAGFELVDVLGGWTADGVLYRTRTQIRQTPVAGPAVDTRRYRTETTGLLVEAERSFTFGDSWHDVSLSLEGFRDTVTTRDPTGSLTPSGRRDVWSLGIEDRVDLGMATVTFGLTAASYKLASVDGDVSGSDLSPRIGVEVPLGPDVTLFASAGTAFRPPTLNESLVSGMHPEPADFEIRPNPNLKPERAKTYEIGITYGRNDIITGGDRLDLSLNFFRNDVRGYIELERFGTLFDSYYSYANISRARVEGVEIEARYDSGGFFGSLSGQVLDGTNTVTGQDLSRLAPDQLVATAGLRSADRRRSVGARYTLAAAKTSGDLRSDSWRTLDLFFTQDIGERATFNLSLNNILGETYTPFLETQPEPGFNAQASLTIRF